MVQIPDTSSLPASTGSHPGLHQSCPSFGGDTYSPCGPESPHICPSHILTVPLWFLSPGGMKLASSYQFTVAPHMLPTQFAQQRPAGDKNKQIVCLIEKPHIQR